MGIIIIKVINRINSLFKIILWKLLYMSKVSFGKKVVFYPNTRVIIDKKGRIKIGNNCFFNSGCSLNSLGEITIGNNTIFGEDVKIYDHNHLFNNSNELIRKQGFKIGRVIIGDNCWIGSNVIILPNVTIGNNVVIGAGAIITKDIEDNSVIVEDISIRKIR